MGMLTYLEIANALRDTLRDAIPAIARAQSMDELTEDYPDLPLLQVYLEESETEDVSFRSAKLNTEVLNHADIIVRPRSHLSEDMAAVVAIGQDLQTALENERVRPLFNLEGIQAFRWRWIRATFQRGAGESAVLYVGVRAFIHVRVF